MSTLKYISRRLISTRLNSKNMTENQVRWYDFTAFEYDESLKEVFKILKKLCVEWNFQEEKAPSTGKLHLQGRMHLIGKGLRLSTLRKRLPGWHLSPTVKINVGDWDYVTKENTRVRGPYSHDDNADALPSHIRDLESKFYPWQKSILEISKVFDDRKINFIVDRVGNIGKSSFCTFCDIKGYARNIPNLPSAKDIMRAVYDLKSRPIYFLDLPRPISKKNMFETYSALESLKNGCCFDDRFKFKMRYFEPPTIWVFTNSYPEKGDYDLLSSDRWRFWNIKEGELVEVSNPNFQNPAVDDFVSLSDSLESTVSEDDLPFDHLSGLMGDNIPIPETPSVQSDFSYDEFNLLDDDLEDEFEAWLKT